MDAALLSKAGEFGKTDIFLLGGRIHGLLFAAAWAIDGRVGSLVRQEVCPGRLELVITR